MPSKLTLSHDFYLNHPIVDAGLQCIKQRQSYQCSSDVIKSHHKKISSFLHPTEATFQLAKSPFKEDNKGSNSDPCYLFMCRMNDPIKVIHEANRQGSFRIGTFIGHHKKSIIYAFTRTSLC